MTTVVYYDSNDVGAPTLNNAAGSMINVLDACLINGYNAKSVTSLVVASAVATATISAHGYEAGRIVEFAGATPAELNGRKKILSVVDANTVTFAATGVGNGTATGTITAKRPGLGWTKVFSATNKAIYGRTDPQATTMLLRVDDTNTGVASAISARALMVESATSIDTYTNFSPASAQLSGGQYWIKGANSSTAKPWILVGDGRTFYFWTDQDNWPFASYGGLVMRAFGDINSYRAGDAYSCILLGPETNTAQGNFPIYAYTIGDSVNNPGFVFARSADSFVYPTGGVFGSGRSGGWLPGASGPSFPSPVDNGLVLQPKIPVMEYNPAFANPIRGIVRGLLLPLGNVGNRLHRKVNSNVLDFDREVLFVGTMAATAVGCYGVDITGPWS